MFTDKQSFVDAFKERFIALNGKSIEDGTEQEVYQTLATMVREQAMPKWIHTRDRQEEKQSKQVIYFSLEFLLGRFLYNNLLSLDVLELVRDGLQDLGYDFTDITELEPEPGLGNGGLGRLAACFLDSLAALSLPGHGNGIRYRYGLFKQKIVDGYQVE
ncbi:MAG: glycogen/starch/alpha-glucan phosphorylase, partial [Exiguobacterium sp.]|nr:glycogen/starch/alpha-glucan phosphorylase [Exiguobacterium sp.]